MKPAQKILSFLFSFVFLFVFAANVNAAQVKNFTIELGDTRPNVSNTHTFTFTHITSNDLYSVEFDYCAEPSGTCTRPTNLITTSADEGAITGLDSDEWSVNNDTNFVPLLENHGDGEDPGANIPFSIAVTTITNQDITGCEAGNATADTCYVRLSTFADIAQASLIDEGIASYTVVQYVDVKARVDPLFSLTVDGVVADNVFQDITISETSDYNDLDFGNLTANTPKYVAHKLTVTTNTENGYTIRARMATPLTGVYAANNIDPFAATGATWNDPKGWTEPTGSTPSVDTGWIGGNTDDADVTQFDAEEFGPINSTNNIVMEESGSDSGATPTYVTYGIEANVFQPADTYSGILLYTALPTY